MWRECNRGSYGPLPEPQKEHFLINDPALSASTVNAFLESV